MEIFKIKKKFKKGGIHINPDIYWGLSLCVGFVIVLCSVAFGFYLFQKINKGLTTSTDSNAQVQKINKERIDDTLQYFSERENKSTEILNSPAPVVDPSL